jgi:hypothetical protein
MVPPTKGNFTGTSNGNDTCQFRGLTPLTYIIPNDTSQFRGLTPPHRHT